MSINATIKKYQSYMRIKGGIPLTPLDMPIAASQVLHKGDFLTYSSGKVTKLIAPSGSVDTLVLIGASTICVGVAALSLTVDASSVSTDGRAVTTVPVVPIYMTEHMLGTIGATNVSTTPSAFTLGSSYALGNFTATTILGGAATWAWAMSLATTNANLRYIALSEESTNTETYGYVWCEFLRSATTGV